MKRIIKIQRIVLSFVFITVCFSQTHAQSLSSEKADFIFVLRIDASENISLSVQDTKKFGNIGSVSNTDVLTNFFKLLNNQDNEDQKINPIFIAKADPSINYGSLVRFLKKIRNSSSERVRVEISKDLSDPYVFTPTDPSEDSNVFYKPNPYVLVVALKSDKKITLNNEDYGTLYNLSLLKNKLIEIFQLREKNGVFREETEEVEKTIFVKADPSLQFNEVIQLIKEIKEAGASPVGLQIDDLISPIDIREEIIKNINDNPVEPK